jgi:Lon protease-like protein
MSDIRTLPVLPLRDIVVFPHMVVPLFVGREKSVRALEEVMHGDKQILLATQKNSSDDEPQPSAIYDVGVIATVLQLLKLPDGTVKVLVEGKSRAALLKFTGQTDYFEAEAAELDEDGEDAAEAEPRRSRAVRELRQAEQEGSPRGSVFDPPDHRAWETGRFDRGSSVDQDRRQAATAGNLQHRQALGEGLRPDGGRDQCLAGRKEDPQPREAADGEDPARILLERADEGDPARTGRTG